jgi:hypothetical protein
MFLIAWDDANTDGKFELTENGVFPKKVFDQGEYPVEFVQYTAIQYQGQTYGE